MAVRSGTAVAAGRAQPNNVPGSDIGVIRFDAATGALNTGFDGDTSPPTTSFASGPADGGFTNDATPSFGFSSNEAVPAYGCAVDSPTILFSCDKDAGHDIIAPLADGPHTIMVKASDRYANLDATAASRTDGCSPRYQCSEVVPAFAAPMTMKLGSMPSLYSRWRSWTGP